LLLLAFYVSIRTGIRIEALMNQYLQRINQVINYIGTYPEADLSLEALADIAHFSPFHFHRIFKDITGETLNHFVNRLRIERASLLLRSNPKLRVLDAALACGYDSAEGFSRAFKKQYGISPSKWDRNAPLRNRKIGQVEGDFPVYTVNELGQAGYEEKLCVEIFPLEAQRLAYLRIVDAYNNWELILDAHDRLISWYQAQGGKLSEAKLYGMSLDDPDITPLEQYRFDWCIAIPEAWSLPDSINERYFPACEVAAVLGQGDLTVMDRTWQYLWRYWLPRSRYQPMNLPSMEIYRRLPLELGWTNYDIWCALPVTAL
jgi:AraC family transcriptional regulator